jgi:hypothetical protein
MLSLLVSSSSMEREGEGERAHFCLETGSPNYQIKEERVKINHLKLKAVLPVQYQKGTYI